MAAPVTGDGLTMIIRGKCQNSLASDGANLIWQYPENIMVNPSLAVLCSAKWVKFCFSA